MHQNRLSPATPRHIHGTPNLSSSHSRHRDDPPTRRFLEFGRGMLYLDPMTEKDLGVDDSLLESAAKCLDAFFARPAPFFFIAAPLGSPCALKSGACVCDLFESASASIVCPRIARARALSRSRAVDMAATRRRNSWLGPWWRAGNYGLCEVNPCLLRRPAALGASASCSSTRNTAWLASNAWASVDGSSP